MKPKKVILTITFLMLLGTGSFAHDGNSGPGSRNSGPGSMNSGRGSMNSGHGSINSGSSHQSHRDEFRGTRHGGQRNAHTKGSRNNNPLKSAPKFRVDWVDLREHDRKRRQSYVEDCAREERPKLA
jgi:hypothetical protein